MRKRRAPVTCKRRRCPVLRSFRLIQRVSIGGDISAYAHEQYRANVLLAKGQMQQYGDDLMLVMVLLL